MNTKMEDYLGNLDDLKTKVAEMSVDLTGEMAFDYVVLVRVSRKHGFTLEYHKDGIGVDDTHDGFWYDFPMFFYWDMPSALFIHKIRKGVFLRVDKNGNFLQIIDVKDFTAALVDDLLKKDYENFSIRWNEFLVEFQKWLEEEME
jgi:hypothetical protein